MAVINTVKRWVKLGLFYKNAAGRTIRFWWAKMWYRITKKPILKNPWNIGLIMVRPDEAHPLFQLPPEFLKIVDEINQVGDNQLQYTQNCWVMAKKDHMNEIESEFAKTPLFENVPETYKEKLAAIRTKKATGIEGIEKFAQAILPQIEEKIYGSYVEVTAPFLEYKFARASLEDSDEKYHSDRHYEDTVRLIMYLNDVDEGTAPFEYLRHKVTGDVPRLPVVQHPKKTEKGRVKKEIVDGYLQNGYESVKVVGPKGTFIIFDSKIIHKANKAKKMRKVLVMPIRPATKKHKQCIDDARTDNAYI